MRKLIAFALVLSASLAFAAEKPNPLRPIEDKPGLPRVLLIGDSISIGYTLPVRQLLEGKANVHRIPVNSRHSGFVRENLDKWLGDGKWDVIHINVGLHDAVIIDGKHQVEHDAYRENLKAIAQRLKETKATLIFATTTPIPDGTTNRKAGDELVYNRIARAVMEEAKIRINDLHAVAAEHPKWQLPKNVHFTDEGSRGLAEAVAEQIRKALPEERQ